MIAAAGLRRYRAGVVAAFDLNADPSLPLASASRGRGEGPGQAA